MSTWGGPPAVVSLAVSAPGVRTATTSGLRSRGSLANEPVANTWRVCVAAAAVPGTAPIRLRGAPLDDPWTIRDRHPNAGVLLTADVEACLYSPHMRAVGVVSSASYWLVPPYGFQ